MKKLKVEVEVGYDDLNKETTWYTGHDEILLSSIWAALVNMPFVHFVKVEGFDEIYEYHHVDPKEPTSAIIRIEE